MHRNRCSRDWLSIQGSAIRLDVIGLVYKGSGIDLDMIGLVYKANPDVCWHR